MYAFSKWPNAYIVSAPDSLTFGQKGFGDKTTMYIELVDQGILELLPFYSVVL